MDNKHKHKPVGDELQPAPMPEGPTIIVGEIQLSSHPTATAPEQVGIHLPTDFSWPKLGVVLTLDDGSLFNYTVDMAQLTQGYKVGLTVNGALLVTVGAK